MKKNQKTKNQSRSEKPAGCPGKTLLWSTLSKKEQENRISSGDFIEVVGNRKRIYTT